MTKYTQLFIFHIPGEKYNLRYLEHSSFTISLAVSLLLWEENEK